MPFPTGTQEEGQTQRKAAFLWGWGSWNWKHPGDRSAVPTICWRLAGFPHRPGRDRASPAPVGGTGAVQPCQALPAADATAVAASALRALKSLQERQSPLSPSRAQPEQPPLVPGDLPLATSAAALSAFPSTWWLTPLAPLLVLPPHPHLLLSGGPETLSPDPFSMSLPGEPVHLHHHF